MTKRDGPGLSSEAAARFRRKRLTTLITSTFTMMSIAALPASGAEATDAPGVETIVVTAQLRAQELKDVPASVTALGEKQLTAQGIANLRDYAALVPGLVYSGTPRNGERTGPDVTLRGISNSRLADMETSISTSTTGFIYGEMPVFSFDPHVMDIARVEVLKGPQGTLYGAASMGGTVKVVPNKPQSQDFTAKVLWNSSTTNDGGANYEYAGVINVPLVENKVAIRASGFKKDDSGYIDARIIKGLPTEIRGRDTTVTGQNPSLALAFEDSGATKKNINGGRVTGERIAVRFTPNEKLDATLSVFHQKTDQDSSSVYEPAVASDQNKRVVELYRLQPSSTDYTIGSFEAAYDLGSMTLTSVTGWLDRKFTSATDFTPQTFAALGGNGTVPVPDLALSAFNVDTRVVSQELRLQGTKEGLVGENSSLDWTLGYYYQKESRDTFAGVTTGPLWAQNAVLPVKAAPSGTQTVWAADYDSTYTNSSLFADGSLKVGRVTASLGGRYSDQLLESTRVDFGNVFAGAKTPTGTTLDVRRVEEKKWTPKASLSYAPTKDVTLYTSAAQGFRIGGGNPVANLTTAPCQAALASAGLAASGNYKSDSVWNYEAGVRSTLANGRIVSNVSLFNVDWSDMQVTVALSTFNPACGQTLVANVGRGRIKGVEYLVQGLITDTLSLDASGQIANAELVEAAKGTPAKSGDPLKNVPKVTYAIGLSQKFSLPNSIRATLRFDYAYQGERSLNVVGTAINPDLLLPSYGIARARMTFAKGDWTTELYADNLFDKVAQLGAQIVAGGPGNYAGAYAPGRQRFIETNRPRTIGMKFTKTF
jgi:iron complex outermembrane receptor protein